MAALITEPPGTPSEAPPPRAPLTPTTQQFKPQQPGAAEQMLETQYRQEGAGLPYRLAPLKADMGRLEGEMEAIDKASPTPPSLAPVKEYTPNPRDGNETMIFAGIAMALSAIGARSAGGDIATAMNTAGAAMDGFAKGDLQRTKTDIELFNTQQKAVVAKNDAMLKEYNAVLNDQKLSMQQKLQQYRVVAAKYQDEIAESAIRKGDIKFELDRLDRVRDANNRFGMQAEGIRSSLEARLAAVEARANRDPSGRGGPMNLSADAIDDQANYVLLNGRMPIGFARMGQEAQQAILNRVSEVVRAAGMTPADYAAAGPLTRAKLSAYQDFEKKRNGIQAYERMLDLNIDVLKDLSAKVNRPGSPYIGKGVLWLQQNATGDADVAEYLFQVNTVATEAARILNNPNLTGQLTDTATQELKDVFGANLNHEQLMRVAERAQADARNRAKGLDEQTQKIIAEIRSPTKRVEPGGGTPAAPKEGDFGTSRSGKPTVFRNGRWEYR